LGAPINDDIRRVFDRMLAAEPQRTVIAPEREVGKALSDIHVQDAAEVAPHEAEARRDLVVSEKQSYLNDLPPEVRNEIDAASRKGQSRKNRRRGSRNSCSASGEAGAGIASSEPLEPVAADPILSPRAAAAARNLARSSQAEVILAEKALQHQSAPGVNPEQAMLAKVLGMNPSPQAPPLLGARESPFTDKAGNIRLENLTTNQDVAQAIRDAAKENNDFIGDREALSPTDR
jgi:hypothetical protein